MSMLSAQVSELRELAEQLDWEQPEVANALRRAADNIEDLSAKCAGLMEERERMRALIGERAADEGVLVELERENAKLRELVWDMADAIVDWYDLIDGAFACESVYEDEKFAPLFDRMRELGVVDHD